MSVAASVGHLLLKTTLKKMARASGYKEELVQRLFHSTVHKQK